MPAVVQSVSENQLVDTAVGPVNVQISTVTGFDIDDFVTSQVNSIAIAIKLYNLATNVNSQYTQNRRIVSIAGATVGGY